jgi:hypothetical protein
VGVFFGGWAILKVSIGYSKIIASSIVIQKVDPMTRGRINPAT